MISWVFSLGSRSSSAKPGNYFLGAGEGVGGVGKVHWIHKATSAGTKKPTECFLKCYETLGCARVVLAKSKLNESRVTTVSQAALARRKSVFPLVRCIGDGENFIHQWTTLLFSRMNCPIRGEIIEGFRPCCHLGACVAAGGSWLLCLGGYPFRRLQSPRRGHQDASQAENGECPERVWIRGWRVCDATTTLTRRPDSNPAPFLGSRFIPVLPGGVRTTLSLCRNCSAGRLVMLNPNYAGNDRGWWALLPVCLLLAFLFAVL